MGEPGAERPAVETATASTTSAALTADIDGDFFAGDGIARVRDAMSAGRLPGSTSPDYGSGAPIARPSAVLCIGQNYAAHAAESGDAPPQYPIVFFKHPNTVVGPFDDVADPAVRRSWTGRSSWRW